MIGLRMADAHPPDLIVLDVDMPGMDGYEVCRALHKGWRAKRIPVVMLTAATDGALNPEVGELGVQAWVPKPALRGGLLAVIEAALARPHLEARTAG